MGLELGCRTIYVSLLRDNSQAHQNSKNHKMTYLGQKYWPHIRHTDRQTQERGNNIFAGTIDNDAHEKLQKAQFQREAKQILRDT